MVGFLVFVWLLPDRNLNAISDRGESVGAQQNILPWNLLPPLLLQKEEEEYLISTGGTYYLKFPLNIFKQ